MILCFDPKCVEAAVMAAGEQVGEEEVEDEHGPGKTFVKTH